MRRARSAAPRRKRRKRAGKRRRTRSLPALFFGPRQHSLNVSETNFKCLSSALLCSSVLTLLTALKQVFHRQRSSSLRSSVGRSASKTSRPVGEAPRSEEVNAENAPLLSPRSMANGEVPTVFHLSSSRSFLESHYLVPLDKSINFYTPRVRRMGFDPRFICWMSMIDAAFSSRTAVITRFWSSSEAFLAESRTWFLTAYQAIVFFM